MSRLKESQGPSQKIDKIDRPQSERRVRKPYRAPRLTVYGRLAELTQFGGSVAVDSGSGLGSLP